LADLQADGLLNFQVRRDSGDFYVKRVVLEVQGESKRVPDAGASIALLGIGLIGLGAFARRRTMS
jgi:hypothetical protein